MLGILLTNADSLLCDASWEIPPAISVDDNGQEIQSGSGGRVRHVRVKFSIAVVAIFFTIFAFLRWKWKPLWRVSIFPTCSRYRYNRRCPKFKTGWRTFANGQSTVSFALVVLWRTKISISGVIGLMSRVLRQPGLPDLNEPSRPIIALPNSTPPVTSWSEL